MSSYLALKIGYINKTHTHTNTQSGAENSLFHFDSPLQKRFLRSISRKLLTIEVSALDELMEGLEEHFSYQSETDDSNKLSNQRRNQLFYPRRNIQHIQ